MRALRVVGLGIDGRSVVLEAVPNRSGEQRERFTLPVDDGLHAAVRGDLPRLGQIEIELESQMRPREIQARIRAGASVDQVATAAGVPAARIERFAYPVLLERSRAAELARQAHPVRSDGPDLRTLDDVIADTFSRRGHDHESVAWDSWRGESGKWVVQLRWRAGRSDNRAHWTFHPGAHGGTVTALDDHAVDLVDPEAGKPLRTVPPADEVATAAPPEQAADQAQAEDPIEEERPLAVPDDGRAHRGPRERPSEPAPPKSPPAQAAEPSRAAADQADKPTAKRGRKDRPIVPSWEDVLLGVRSPRT